MKPFKLDATIPHVTDTISVNEMPIQLILPGGCTYAEAREHLHFFYLSTLRSWDIATLKLHADDLKQASTLEAYRKSCTSIAREYAKVQHTTLGNAGEPVVSAPIAKALFQLTQKHFNRIVEEVAAEALKEEEREAKEKLRRSRIVEAVGAEDPENKFINAVRDANQTIQKRKKDESTRKSHGRKAENAAAPVDHVGVFLKSQAEELAPPCEEDSQETDFSQFVGSPFASPERASVQRTPKGTWPRKKTPMPPWKGGAAPDSSKGGKGWKGGKGRGGHSGTAGGGQMTQKGKGKGKRGGKAKGKGKGGPRA